MIISVYQPFPLTIFIDSTKFAKGSFKILFNLLFDLRTIHARIFKSLNTTWDSCSSLQNILFLVSINGHLLATIPYLLFEQHRTCLQITKLFRKNDLCFFMYYTLSVFRNGKELSCIRMITTNFHKPWRSSTMKKYTMKKIILNDIVYHWSAVNNLFTMMSVWTIKDYQFN